jgi:hypothetical protein
MPMTFSGEGLFLFRQKPDSHVLVQDFGSGSSDVLNVRDLDQDTGAGMRFTALMQPGWSDIEVTYFGVENWGKSRSLVASSLVGYQLPDLDDSQTYDNVVGVYDSKLYNGEINLRCPICDCLTGIMGFRWAELKEHAGVWGTYGPGTDSRIDSWTESRTTNDLFGFQMGGDLAIGRGTSPLWVNAIVKGGVFSNQVRRQQDIVAAGSDAFTQQYDQRDGRASFIGEVALRATWEFTSHVSAFGGYQAMWLGGVALAPDHLSRDVTVITDDQTQLFHGASAGFEAHW